MKAFHEVRNYPSDFMVWHKAYENISFIAHWHREIELLYIRKGSIKMQVTDHSFTAAEGDLIICDTGDIHYSNSYEKDSCLDFLIFDTSLISSHYQYHCFSKPLLTASEMKKSGLDLLLQELEQTVDNELSEHREYYQDIIRASLRSFWFRLLRVMPVNSDPGIMQNRRNTMLNDFQNLLSYMEEHTQQNITLDEAADRMHFSPSHFSKVFKQLIGINFVKYLNIIRVTQASEMLLNPDMNITQTAYSCGFQNIRTFNRVFKEVTGQTPSAYLSVSENQTANFTYYKSSSNITTYAEKDPLTIVKGSPT